MEYNKALKVLANNKHLIGKMDKGATIDELILVPTNSNLTESFLKLYLQTLDGNKAIIPFLNVDVDVVAVFDKKRIVGQGIFFHTNIYNLPEILGIKDEE